MSAMEKQEIVSKLYLIRSVLSKISLKRDLVEKLKVEKKKIELAEFDYESDKEKMFMIAQELSDKKEELELLNEETPKLKEDLEKVKAEKEKKENEKPMGFFGKLVAVLVADILPVIISYFLGKWWINTDRSFWVGCLFFPIAVLTAIWTLILLIGFFSSEEKTTEKEKEKISSLNEQIEKNEKKASVLLEEIEELYESLEAEEIKIEAEKACALDVFNQEKERKTDEKNRDIVEVVDETAELYDFVKSIDCIDSRDWKILDVIIYELETGRADTIKEALQRADEYIRHEALMAAMEVAMIAICKTVRESISELSSNISSQIAGLRKDVSSLNEGISELRDSQERMNTAFDSLLNEQEMTNALLEKANVSSQQLAADVERMRWLRDQEFSRNGI